jgi:hypothetical protein
MGRKSLGPLLTHSVTVRMSDFSYTRNKEVSAVENTVGDCKCRKTGNLSNEGNEKNSGILSTHRKQSNLGKYFTNLSVVISEK